jgi:small conductance mechanosensitive channel
MSVVNLYVGMHTLFEARVFAQTDGPIGTPRNGTTTEGPLQNGPFENQTAEAVGVLDRVLPQWVPNWLITIVVAIAVLVIAWYLSKLVVKQLHRPVARKFRRPSVTRTVLRTIQVGIMVIAILTAAGVVGVGLGNILLSVTVLTAAISIALAPILGSIISGLFVLADQPYEIGDMIEIGDVGNATQDGQMGFVEDITLRYTKIFTLDNTFLVVPNGSIRERDVINYSAEDSRQRRTLDLVVTYESALDDARRLCEQAASEVDAVISGGPDIRIGSTRYSAAPYCLINSYGDHGIVLTLTYWVHDPYKPRIVPSLIQENIRTALADADVEFAYPHSHLVFDETSGNLSVSIDSTD